MLRYKKNNLTNSRFGFVISAKVSKKAVDRNKIRRRASEIIRLNIDNIRSGFDIIFVIKKEACGVEYSELENNILNSLKERNLL